MTVHEIPGVLRVEWNDDAKAMIDTWSNYMITVPQFREAILEKGVAHGKVYKSQAWIVDSSRAKGAFPQDVQKLIETEVFKTFAAIGVKYFITIKSASAITNMSIDRYTAQCGPAGLQMIELPDQDTALQWLKNHR